MDRVLYFKKNLVPTRFFYKGETAKISKVDKDFIISGYTVYLSGDSIKKVIIEGKHPNAHPVTGEFCLEERIKSYKFDEQLREYIELLMSYFYLDDCYFRPWLNFDWED